MKIIKKHIEWFVFLSGLILLGTMSPYIQNTSFCFFDFIGISFCPGEGLGHSIAFTFRGEFKEAFSAHFMGPITVLILSGRILFLWKSILISTNEIEKAHG